jgi:hypothetical protein
MISPLNLIIPAVGTKDPEMRLKSVVFPAPFGPINPIISLSFI